MPKIIDLSTPHENGASESFPPEITYKDHKDGASRLGKLADIPPEEFPDGMGLATERIVLTSHSGTHVDSPYHFGPTSEGKKARTIDEVPLDWCYGPGVVLDFRHLPPGSNISAEQVQEALAKIDHTLSPGEIVLIETGTDKYWMTEEYLPRQCGLSREATAWILDHGIRCIGIDAWGLDRPVKEMVKAHKAGEPNALWPSHFYGREKEYLQIEKLANLDKLPPTGFTVSAFPVKISHASAGWCRAVAIFND